MDGPVARTYVRVCVSACVHFYTPARACARARVRAAAAGQKQQDRSIADDDDDDDDDDGFPRRLMTEMRQKMHFLLRRRRR